MANPANVETLIRFALSQLPEQNAHHVFEHICRHLTGQFICSNVLPATGPVSAGGDQGRDFETFRSYLRKELGPHGAFIGLVSEGTVAFICTTQADGLPRKLRQDIKKVCASGHLVHEIRAFTLEPVTVASRHKLETETQELYDVRLELHDAESIANLLARPEGFWIAEQFLSIPAEVRPEPADIEPDISADYIERRRRWREKGSPNPTLGDFIDLKAGIRETVFHEEARDDFPFWLGLLRQLLAIPDLPIHIQQRARYELVVTTFCGTREFRTVDNVARAYLDESLNEIEPARLGDACALLLYAHTAVRYGLSSFSPAELGDWNARLTNRIQELATCEAPHRRASLLFTLGHLGVHPTLTEADIHDLSDESQILEGPAENNDPSTLADTSSMRADQALTNAPLALSAWTKLMDNIDETPLFSIQELADILQLLVPLWSDQAEWRELLDRVDEAVGKRSGQVAIVARARDRALKLLQAERHLDALEELHRAKIDWWSGETIRGSLLSMVIIARLYLELWFPHASKSYALAVAYIAASEGNEDLADLVSAGLFMAANADFAVGAWCSAMELYELGLIAQLELIEDGADWEKHREIEQVVMNVAYITTCAKAVDAELAELVDATTERIGVREIIEEAVDGLNLDDKEFWKSFGDIGLIDLPFADLGESRRIHFAALGTEWTLVTENDSDSVRVAERFAAAAQVILAALAREDLCLIKTEINIRVETTRHTQTPAADPIESLPSNDGREWVIQLAPIRNSDGDSSKESDAKLLAMLAIILREASLLSDSDFSDSLDRAFEKGLGHKLSPGRPYDELAAAFATDTKPEIQRSRYIAPWNSCYGTFRTHDRLRWQDGPGPTYSQDTAKELLETRYKNLAKSLRITVAMLSSSEEFRPIVKELRTLGWLDWHILTAILNIVMSYRFLPDSFNLLTEATRKQMTQAAYGSESATAKPVPIGFFTVDAMNESRQFALITLLRHWGLDCRQETPDLTAIEQFLADRYGYWEDDMVHDDPFPETGHSGVGGGLIVIEDVSSEDRS